MFDDWLKEALLPLSKGLLVIGLLLGSVEAASALSKEEALENCRMTIGKSMVQACMQANGVTLDACRARAKPKVIACTIAALKAANRRANVAAHIRKADAPRTRPERQQSGEATASETQIDFKISLQAPPRTITDIKAILEAERPDAAAIAKLGEQVRAQPAKNASSGALAKFYFERSDAWRALARQKEAIADAELAVKYVAKEDRETVFRYKRRLALIYLLDENPKALSICIELVSEAERTAKLQGFLPQLYRFMSSFHAGRGNLVKAEHYLARNVLLSQKIRTSPGFARYLQAHGANWQSDLEHARARVLEARGRYPEAEAAFRKAEALRWQSLRDAELIPAEKRPPRLEYIRDIVVLMSAQARMFARQARLTESEILQRRALVAWLRESGKYDIYSPAFIAGLGSTLALEGRYSEAETLVKEALNILDELGVPEDGPPRVRLLNRMAQVHMLARNFDQLSIVTARIAAATKDWDPETREYYTSNEDRIGLLYANGRAEEGIVLAETIVKKRETQYGSRNFFTASARATLATGYAEVGRDEEAIRELKAALPVLQQASLEAPRDDIAFVARDGALRDAAETYFRLLARQTSDGANSKVFAETFRLSDSLRGRAVQRALSASSARAAAGSNTALADLIRTEQDLTAQLNAQLAALNNLLSASPEERTEADVKAAGESVEAIRRRQQKATDEIVKRFPSYAEMLDPKPPSSEEINATLSDDEVFVSYYFGRARSFVWAVSKKSGTVFAEINAASAQIEEKVTRLREAVDSNIALVSDVPVFDVQLAHELYSVLLKPIEQAWKPAKSLIIVTNGALGLLPLYLLPTEPTTIAEDGDVLFSEYRNVPWLARTHAVSSVPSASSLLTLRRLPAARSGRSNFAGFGDPMFSVEQAEVAAVVAPASDASSTVRGRSIERRNTPKLKGVDSAELAQLPRLPDTAEELRSIALALQVDPVKVLSLGKEANETLVKTMDLSGYKVIAFATHGLVPGELNGLTQPALALSSPTVTGNAEDGLLTMEEILGLKLDADWVILSACNTATGVGAGAEAASGLGRAFFYAGTRALLVTNWSVHSQSARELVTDLFKRQAENPDLGRSEALRQAMMDLVDGPGYKNAEGKTEFSYAHPLFWAPYTIIGDVGAKR